MLDALLAALGAARRPGLHCLAHVVAPAAFLEDMKMMGVLIQEETTKLTS